MTDRLADMIRTSAANFSDINAAMGQLRTELAGNEDVLRALIESIHPDPYESIRASLAVVRSGALRCTTSSLTKPDPRRDPRHIRPETIRRCAERTGVAR